MPPSSRHLQYVGSIAAILTILHEPSARAQNPSAPPYPSGPYTGEVSAEVLAQLGVRLVMAGHPERRRLFGETDEVIRAKVAATAAAGMAPILVVGE